MGIVSETVLNARPGCCNLSVLAVNLRQFETHYVLHVSDLESYHRMLHFTLRKGLVAVNFLEWRRLSSLYRRFWA